MTLVVESRDKRQFAIFRSEKGGGVVISQQEMLELSNVYSKLYDTYIPRLSNQFTNRFKLTEPAASTLTRRALVPLVHCFFDRLIRAKKAIDIAPSQLTVPYQRPFAPPSTIEAFERCAVENPKFNQSIIGFVGRVWELPESELVPEPILYKPQAGFKNNLFRLYRRTPYHLIKKVILRILARLPVNRYPALTMANAQGALAERGFYFRFFEDVSPKWQLTINSQNKSLRELIFADEYIKNAELDKFLGKLGLDEHEQDRARQLFKEFLQTYYPSSLLEAVPENIQLASRSLQKFKKKVLFSSGGRCSRSVYVVAVAKQRGFLIIDQQHGGHYGYLEDVNSVLELEYPGIDQFISWGWSRLPKHTALKSLSVIDLPSPWLSERKRYWSNLTIGGDKEFDILLMPNMVKRFTGAPQGSSSSRIDLIQEMSASLITMVRKTSENGIKVLHKPYNTTTIGLLSSTLKDMEAIGGSLYLCENQLDKGLTYELLERCHIVVWDQPGTGFLECLTSKIPTMIYWPRTYCQEEEWTKSDFNNLEQVGIIHRNIDTLIGEILNYKKSPEEWMKSLGRVSVINNFCRKYAWVSDDWHMQWKNYLGSLNK